MQTTNKVLMFFSFFQFKTRNIESVISLMIYIVPTYIIHEQCTSNKLYTVVYWEI